MAESIPALLKSFGKQNETHKGDSKQVELVCLYLLLRQLTPALPFETFLQMYAPLADADEMNLKMPDTAVDHYLPRAKSKAEKNSVRQWSAKEVVGYLALYVDMIREAEATNTPIPMPLNQWLCSPAIQTMFLNGEFDTKTEAVTTDAATTTREILTEDAAEDATPVPDTATPVAPVKKQRAAKKASATPKSDSTERPTTAGQRVLYSHPSGRQIRGITVSVVDGAADTSGNIMTYVTFHDDAGQLYEEVACKNVKVISDPLPQPPQNVTAEQLIVIETLTVDMTPDDMVLVDMYLKLDKKRGNVAADAIVWEWQDTVSSGGVEYNLYVLLHNGDETSPAYVDAYATTADSPVDSPLVVCELQPRNGAILGTYMFTLPHGTVRVQFVRETVAE